MPKSVQTAAEARIRTARHDLEAAILQSMLNFDWYHDLIFRALSPESFNNQALSLIFSAAQDLWKENASPSNHALLRTKIEESEGVIPPWYWSVISGISDSTIEATSDLHKLILDFDAKDIPRMVAELVRLEKFDTFKQGAASARTLEDMRKVATAALDDDGIISKTDEPDWKLATEEFLTVQEKIWDGTITAGHSWGIETLDDQCLLTPGCLYIVAGIKKGGKSQFLQHVMMHNAIRKNPVFFFSLEMGIRQVIRRWVAHETSINSRTILTRNLPTDDHARLAFAARFIAALPISVNQSPRITASEILRRVRAWKRRDKVPDGHGVVCVDFLQLMPLPEKKGQNDAAGIKEVAYDLARLAKETQTAVIAAVQLRNEAEGQRPQLRYIEGSGGISQAAESILLLDLHARREEHLTTAGFVPMDVILFQRNGESGRKVEMIVDLSTSQFFPKTASVTR